MSRMSSFLKKTLVLIFLGFIVHLAFIYYFPYLKMWMITKKSESENVVNVAFYKDVPNANSRQVIRPSPDLMYSGCGYDITYEPLIIKTSIPQSYWSISFFADNSDNFSNINNENLGEKNITVYLFGPNSKPSKIEDGYVIVSPSNKGLMLIRQFIGNGSNLDSLYEIQTSLECYSLSD